MNSRTTRQFRELLAALPRHVRQQAREAYRLFRDNPRHPGLHFKRVHEDPPIFSARVGIGFERWVFARATQSFGFGSAPTRSTIDWLAQL